MEIPVQQMKINTITINSSDSYTELCKLGVEFPTDKSPYNTESLLHKHAYTPVYDFMFSPFRYKNIIMGELGIYNNMSMLCWRKYFPNATLYGFENNEAYLNKAMRDGLSNTSYINVDVTDSNSIEKALSGITFDILIDDSTHNFADQIRIIHSSYNHLSKGGILVIEDIFLSAPHEEYAKEIEDVTKYFSSITFVKTEHSLQQSVGWNNDQLLILVRNDV